MLGVVALAALAHLPRFPGDLQHEAEPSIASYNTHTATYSVKYEKGDSMYAIVYRPETYGFQYEIDGDVWYDAAIIGGCATGAPFADSHGVYRAPGETMYEMWGESQLEVITTLVANMTSPVAQTCLFKITTSHTHLPYVFVTGTTEDVLPVLITGLPYYVMHISMWAGNYVYPLALLVTLGVVIVRTRVTYRDVAIASTLATASNRWAQALIVGVGAGQLFTIAHVAVAYMLYKRTYPRLTLAIAWLSPTRWWSDAVLVTAAIVFP